MPAAAGARHDRLYRGESRLGLQRACASDSGTPTNDGKPINGVRFWRPFLGRDDVPCRTMTFGYPGARSIWARRITSAHRDDVRSSSRLADDAVVAISVASAAHRMDVSPFAAPFRIQAGTRAHVESIQVEWRAELSRASSSVPRRPARHRLAHLRHFTFRDRSASAPRRG